MTQVPRSTLLIAFVLASCASSGTRPHDMSAGHHHAAAEGFERASQEHAGRTDPGEGARCGYGGGACWSTLSNQAAHQQEARSLHELAEKHRAAGDALVKAELEACAGLTEADRDVSPFVHRDDIASVSALSRPGETSDAGTRLGATIRFRAVEGLTLRWLQQAVRCHLARSAALGHPAEFGYCPLAVNGARAEASSTASGLQVEVWANDATTGAEIRRRAQELLAR